MKKKILSCVLLLFMIIAFFPKNIEADTPTKIVDLDDLKAAISNGGNYILMSNIDIPKGEHDETDVSKTLTLDLNGHYINHCHPFSTFEVQTGGVLYLINTSETPAYITHENAWDSDETDKKSFAIVKATGTGKAYLGGNGSKGIVELKGSNDIYDIDGFGAGVRLTDGGGYFEMNEFGKISNCIANGGGAGICVDAGGIFVMNGGSIEDCAANKKGGADGMGAAVLNRGTFKMFGGVITNNKVDGHGGGVYNEGTMIIGKNAKITGNTLIDGTTVNNLYLPSSELIQLATGENVPTSEMSAGISLENTTGTFVESITTGDYIQYFSSDKEGYYPRYIADSSKYVIEKVFSNTIVAGISNGTITVNKEKAFKNEVVTITVVPASGYRLVTDSLKATYNGGTECDLTSIGDSKYTYTMPEYDVSLMANFEEVPSPGPGPGYTIPNTGIRR